MEQKFTLKYTYIPNEPYSLINSKLVHVWIQPIVTTLSHSNEGISTVATALQLPQT